MERCMTQRRFLLTDLLWAAILVGFLIAPAIVPLDRSISATPTAVVQAQAPARGAAPVQASASVVISLDVKADRRVTFRILAPEATKVELRTPGDIPGDRK